jgi:hypothetical protein
MLTSDTILNSATYWFPVWSSHLIRGQSWRVLRLVLSKLYGPNGGSLFHRRARSSHAAIAQDLGLSRQWTCELLGRLCDAGWFESSAPRLPDGKQEISTFRPGRMLKRLLIMLLRSHQRLKKNRVNAACQKVPTKEDVEKNLRFLRKLREDLAQKLGTKT